MKVELMPQQDPTDSDRTYLGVKISALEDVAAAEVLRAVVRIVAERYVEAHYAEICAHFDQTAIANLAVADAGKKIAEEIRMKPPQIDTKEIAREIATLVRRG
jgi:hypothetical protein